MKNFKEWLSCQLLSKSLICARPFSFFYEESPDGELDNQESNSCALNIQLKTLIFKIQSFWWKTIYPMCRRNTKGEKILPNGQVWMSQFLLLCIATKVLGDANTLLRFQDSLQLKKTGTKLPSLPHLLSSLLRPRHSSEDEFDELSDDGEDDEYDRLPPTQILRLSIENYLKNREKLILMSWTNETLYLKKQWKVEFRRPKEDNDDDCENDTSQEVVQLPDIAIQLNLTLIALVIDTNA